MLAVLAAALTYRAPRWGAAFALALPIFPLGNVALSLALLYGVVALAWFLLSAREPERTLLPALGPLLGPLAPALVPVVFVRTKSAILRAAGAATAIVLAVVVHGVRAGPIGLGLPESRDPATSAKVLVQAAPHSLVYMLPAVAFAAVVLPWVVRRAQQLSRRASEARTYTG